VKPIGHAYESYIFLETCLVQGATRISIEGMASREWVMRPPWQTEGHIGPLLPMEKMQEQEAIFTTPAATAV